MSNHMANKVVAVASADSAQQAAAGATAEVIPLITMGALSPMRIFVSLFVLLVFLLVAFFSPRQSTKRKASAKGTATVVLAGPMASGKTSLFYKLLYNQAPMTHTSMEENEAIVDAKFVPEDQSKEGTEKSANAFTSETLRRPLHLVDTPGHPRLRTRSLAQFLPTADQVVFVLDAATGLGGKNIRDAGEHLHVVLCLLTHLSTLTNRPPPPLLILLAKSDLLTSKSSSFTLDRARQSLAREMERRRVASHTSTTRAGARLEGLDAISASATSASLVQSLLKAFGLGAPAPVVDVGGIGLPSDEAEVLGGDAFAFEGEFGWDKLEVEVEWELASIHDGETSGVEKLLEWIERS